MPTTSPNMGLIVPIASTGASGTGDVGPGYASNISTDLSTTIDQHDHSSGKGVQITPAGLNISSDLTVASNNVTNVRGVRFTSQASALAGVGDTSEVYVKSGDLWYVNASGTQVQLTAGSALGTGPVGPTGPAGTSFVQNYFQAGVTGATAMNVGSGGLISWNQALSSSGNVTQPTGNGTGAAWINVTAAGLYQVSYQLGFTGSSALSVVGAYQTINGTGIGIGSSIPQSAQYARLSLASGIAQPITADYIVSLGANVNVETWLSVATGSALALNPTGTLFTIAKIG